MKSAITLYALFLAVNALVFGASVHAAETIEQRVVQYGDLNLNSPQGVAKLYKRISSAARSVCGPSAPVSLSFIAAQRQCRAQAIAAAVQDVNNANLTAHHLQRIGQSGETKVASRR